MQLRGIAVAAESEEQTPRGADGRQRPSRDDGVDEPASLGDFSPRSCRRLPLYGSFEVLLCCGTWPGLLEIARRGGCTLLRQWQ